MGQTLQQYVWIAVFVKSEHAAIVCGTIISMKAEKLLYLWGQTAHLFNWNVEDIVFNGSKPAGTV
jgi:hypothetical protein